MFGPHAVLHDWNASMPAPHRTKGPGMPDEGVNAGGRVTQELSLRLLKHGLSHITDFYSRVVHDERQCQSRGASHQWSQASSETVASRDSHD
jgi:hypothetical protein